MSALQCDQCTVFFWSTQANWKVLQLSSACIIWISAISLWRNHAQTEVRNLLSTLSNKQITAAFQTSVMSVRLDLWRWCSFMMTQKEILWGNFVAFCACKVELNLSSSFQFGCKDAAHAALLTCGLHDLASADDPPHPACPAGPPSHSRNLRRTPPLQVREQSLNGVHNDQKEHD